jgi:hypothetical protein
MDDTWAWPVHGLRHPPAHGSSGWYLWTGELRADHDFFRPLHVRHVIEACPPVERFLHLAPGFRFLVAQDYEDVWFDAALLRTDD